jgi:hypothetical protein
MSNNSWPAEQAKAFFKEQLPQLDYWNKKDS